MATTKTYSAVVRGGFWETNGIGTLTPIPGSRSFSRRFTAQRFGGSGLAAMRELAETLNGAAPGGVAFKAIGVVSASPELGGLRPIAMVAAINRVTTAADKQELDEDLWTMTNRTTFGAFPPINGDRNPLGTR
jgi:hypothetical protein